MIRTEALHCTCPESCARHLPCVAESDNIKPEDCICDVHALEAWMNEGSPRSRMRKAEQER
jgi:hypothetical protein